MAGARTLKIVYDETHFAHRLDQYEGAIRDGAIRGLEYAAKGAAGIMRKRVENTGTAWSRFRPGVGIGREETGAMLESIDYYDRERKGISQVIIGYIDNVRQYFRFQEYGFESWGRWMGPRHGFVRGTNPSYRNNPEFAHNVRGIHALKDAQTVILQTAPPLIGSWAARTARNVGKK